MRGQISWPCAWRGSWGRASWSTQTNISPFTLRSTGARDGGDPFALIAWSLRWYPVSPPRLAEAFGLLSAPPLFSCLRFGCEAASASTLSAAAGEVEAAFDSGVPVGERVGGVGGVNLARRAWRFLMICLSVSAAVYR